MRSVKPKLKIVVSLAAASMIFLAAYVVLRPDGGQPIPPGVVAQVAGKDVTADDVQALRRAFIAAEQKQPALDAVCRNPDSTSCRDLNRNIDESARQQAVYNLQVLGEAERRRWTFTDQELAEAKTDPMYKALPEPQRTQWLKVRAAGTRLTKEIYDQEAAVTPEEVFAEYQARKESFTRPERRSFQTVVLNTEREARAVKRKLKAGLTFRAAVRRYNLDDANAVGSDGVRYQVTRRKLPKRLGAAVFAAPAGKLPEGPLYMVDTHYRPGPVRGPVQAAPGQWHVFRVTDIVPGQNITYRRAYAIVKKDLLERRRAARAHRAEQAFKAYWKKHTRCAADEGDLCDPPSRSAKR